MMSIVSAHIDKHLKDKITSKAHKEAKSVSNIIKEALNEVDFDKEDYKEVDDESKIKGEEVAPPILSELNNLTARVGEIEDSLVEIGKMEVCLGEIITKQAVEHEKQRLDEMQREDANRIYLHNLIIQALEETTNKNLEECKSNHPRLSS